MVRNYKKSNDNLIKIALENNKKFLEAYSDVIILPDHDSLQYLNVTDNDKLIKIALEKNKKFIETYSDVIILTEQESLRYLHENDNDKLIKIALDNNTKFIETLSTKQDYINSMDNGDNTQLKWFLKVHNIFMNTTY